MATILRNLVPFVVGALIPLTIAVAVIDAQDASTIAKRAFVSTVYLETKGSQGTSLATGSGYFVGPSLVITNLHVIRGAETVTVKLIGKTDKFKVDGVAAFDEENDLAILRVVGVKGIPMILEPTAPIAGQEIFAIGSPKGLEGTISPGIVSGSSIRDLGGSRLIQISAPISPGSSCGPVINRLGKVVGVAVGSLVGGQNLNFAVPALYIENLIERLKTSKFMTFGEFVRRPRKRESVLAEIEPSTAWLVNNLQNSVIVSDSTGNPPAALLAYVANLKIDGCRLSFETGVKTVDKLGVDPGTRGYVEGLDLGDLAKMEITTWNVKSEFSKTGVASEIKLVSLHRLNYTSLPTPGNPNPKQFNCPGCTNTAFNFDQESKAERALAVLMRVSQLCKVYRP